MTLIEVIIGGICLVGLTFLVGMIIDPMFFTALDRLFGNKRP